MFYQTWKKLFLSATSATLISLGLSTFSANAITFQFQGERIKGTYSLNENVYSAWLSNISNPTYDQNGIADFTIGVGLTDLKLFIDGTEIGYTPRSSYVEFLAVGTYFLNSEEDFNYFDVVVGKNYGSGQSGQFFIARDISREVTESHEKLLDCIVPGKTCVTYSGFDDPVLRKSFIEQVTHSVVTGSSRLVPISAQQVGDALMFDNAQSGFWFATPSSISGNSFELEMAGDAKFNAVSNFLAGLNDSSLFTISVGDSIVGQYKSGDNIDFVKLLGSGVSKFKVTSNQGFTASDLKALSSPTYSSQFIFDRETASFKMTSSSQQPNPQPKPVPEPTSALALLIFGGAWMLKRRTSSAKVQLVSKSDAVA